MQLRNYQIKIIEELYEAWKHVQNVIIQLPTGGGKTCTFCKVISEHRGKCVVIAHRSQLLVQISLTLAHYGIKHNLITNQTSVKDAITLQMQLFKKSFFSVHASVTIIGVDTLLRRGAVYPDVTLIIQDEGHHALKNNKWGKVAGFFPNAKGLYPTATPTRADGKGLGRAADGLVDHIIVGPSMRELIYQGWLTDYRVFAPQCDIDLTTVPLGIDGDFSQPKLRKAVGKSRIVGDIVLNYLKFASGKLGLTFAVSIESATAIAAEFRKRGVPAEVMSSKTPDMLRAEIMRRFERREILQIVNVDLFGEGVDVPAIEVVSFGRPTQSYALYVQQFGRALRPLPGKEKAIIIDHVNNVVRHGLPDDPREWTLARRERRGRGESAGVPLRTCLNPECVQVYKRIHKCCPYCGFYPVPSERSLPEHVDGDLTELDLSTLRREIKRIDEAPRVPQNLSPVAQRAIINQHHERQQTQRTLRESIAQWAGYLKEKDYDDSMIYREFYFTFGIDIATAQTLGVREAEDVIRHLGKALEHSR